MAGRPWPGSAAASRWRKIVPAGSLRKCPGPARTVLHACKVDAMATPWDDFRLVKAIADHGGLTAAAARLGINHSTAFRRLAAIEAALGTRLFERSRTGYAATRPGHAMVAAAAPMEETAAQFAREVAGRASEPAGLLRVTAPCEPRHRPADADLRRVSRRAARGSTSTWWCPTIALNLSRRDADVAIRASNAPAAEPVRAPPLDDRLGAVRVRRSGRSGTCARGIG